ncbi:MAG TPA: hydroxymethylbilane synthase [Burkholderiales bacterium]
MTLLRIGTRKSALALWQAEHVRARLRAHHPQLAIELVKITTTGDRILDRPLAAEGGKGLFIKELEQALLEHRIDLAVHSMKDLTVTLPDGLHVAAVLERADPRDAFVSVRYARLDELPAGARIGTSSLRRQCQLRARYPHCEVVSLRGNVNTRLAKLDAGEFDALILAVAGLERLGWQDRIREKLDPAVSLPAVAQGAICVETRRDDEATNALLAVLDHPETRECVTAERTLNAHLDGGCQVPIGAYAERRGEELHLRGLVGDPDGNTILTEEAYGPRHAPEALGRRVAEALRAAGAGAILARVYGRV